jgi:hypothetical protein
LAGDLVWKSCDRQLQGKALEATIPPVWIRSCSPESRV